MVSRTIHIIDTSGILDILAPAPPPGRRGRKGRIRENTRLWLIGVILCTRLGHETTVRGVHGVLTEALPRESQWELGVLRSLTSTRKRAASGVKSKPNGKPHKEIWFEEGYERLGYDDLMKVTTKIRAELDYGHGSAPDLDDTSRRRRRELVADVVDRLIIATTTPTTSTTIAIDGTGQWAWSRGAETDRTAARRKLANGTARDSGEDHNPK